MTSLHRPRTAAMAALLALMTLASLVVLPPAPAEASTSATDAEREFIALVNVERARHGLHALVERADITSVARSWSATMARRTQLAHNPDFQGQIRNWQRLSENVGRGPSVESLHRALMNSEGHRRNILDDRVTEIGVGVVVADGRVWVTQNFRRPSSNAVTAPPSTTQFGDVSSRHAHASAIVTVAQQGIAAGCTPARFCPDGSVTRGEFASMLSRAMKVPPTSTRRFTDVSGPHAAAIEALAAAGVTTGCAADRFCPDQRLSRAQMASFLARALGVQPSPSSFTDTHPAHDGAIGALNARGIVLGCSATRFCSSQGVNRAQTASMLARTFG